MDNKWRTLLQTWYSTNVRCFRCGETVLIARNKGALRCRQHTKRANAQGIHPCCGKVEVDPGHENALGCVPCDHPTKGNIRFTHRHDETLPLSVARKLDCLLDQSIVEIREDGYFPQVVIRRYQV